GTCHTPPLLYATYRPVGRSVRRDNTPASMPPQRRNAATPRPDARRAEICRTAAQIFRDRGFDATPVSDLARALGLTQAGLYHYYDSKGGLLSGVISF